MNFNDFPYQRPSIDTISDQMTNLLAQFEAAETADAQIEVFRKIEALRTEFDSMHNLCMVRHTINTRDSFYESENEFFDSNQPLMEDFTSQLYRAVLASPFRSVLETTFGKQFFVIAELTVKTFKPTILEDLKEENKLKSEYVKLMASAKLDFDGKTLNLSSITPYEGVADRSVRKSAAETKWAFYAENEKQIDETFDKLVKVRTRIAKALGYENFIELGYARMLRSDYNASMAADFRQQILDHVVPVASKLKDRQAKRIGVDQLKYYDEDFKFKSGNPKPKGQPDWIIEQAKTMYQELSGETHEFFTHMTENDLLDLLAKDGKAPGGYCTFIGKYKAPFIFSNFNGTSGDIDVLTHEAGHAFQVYSSKEQILSEYNWPTYEACEIHSMSMEFFTWPWMKLFFKEDTDKYKFAHLSGGLTFLPYGVAVDEFQHFVYGNPDATPAERDQAWLEIEQKYMPNRDYDGNEYLASGGFWKRQRHIFEMPFYYIDYTLALICAYQFWIRDVKDHEDAWSDYVKLCQIGGSQSFLDLVSFANLKSPFQKGVAEEIIQHIDAWLEKVDDSSF